MATKKTESGAAEPAKRTVTRRRTKVTREMIELRAYMISVSEGGGSPLDNWLSAERELTGK